MRIIIVGAGEVGSYLAERLSMEGQDVVVIESSAARASEVQAATDTLVLRGNGASPHMLEEAGVGLAGLLIAVTNSDAVNILACRAAARLGVSVKVARVEDPALRDGLQQLGVDVVIDPVEELARELLGLVAQQGASELIEFAGGKLVLLGGYVRSGAPVVGVALSELRARVVGWTWLVVAVVRDGTTMIARQDITIQEDDHVFIMAKVEETSAAIRLMGLREEGAGSAMILGSTRLARLTAELFAGKGIRTCLVAEGAGSLSIPASNGRVNLVDGDPTDPAVMRSGGVETVDTVLALTDRDSTNILGALVARALGAGNTVARLSRFELIPLLADQGIDAAVSSRLAAANAILRYVRRGQIYSVVTFEDTDAEVIELQVGPDSKAIGKSLIEVGLPKSVMVGGVLRRGEAFEPRGKTVIQADDHLIIFAMPKAISGIERLFE